MVTTLSHMASYTAACRASPVIIYRFSVVSAGKRTPEGGKTRRSGTEKRCSHKCFHLIFPYTDPCTNIFLYLASGPPASMGLHTNPHAVHGRFTLKDDCERQVWNAGAVSCSTWAINKHNLWAKYFTSWRHYGWRLDCKLSYSVKRTTQLPMNVRWILMLRKSMSEGRDNFAMLEDWLFL